MHGHVELCSNRIYGHVELCSNRIYRYVELCSNKRGTTRKFEQGRGPVEPILT